MRRSILALASLGLLAACGVDGAPRPPVETPEPGVTVSGDARIGVRAAL